MARIRTIKPEFPHSESMGRVSREARLCFMLMWTIADDEGRLRGNSRMLASLLFPYDEDAGGLIEGWLAELERELCLDRYAVEGSTYIQIRNWLKHQKIDKPSKSKIPPCDEGSRILSNPREGSSEDLRIEGSKDLGSKDLGPTARTQDSRTVARIREASAKAPRETLPQWEGHRQWAMDELRPVYPSNLYTDADWESAARVIAGRIESGETTRESLLQLVTAFAAQQVAKGNRNTQFIENPARHFDGRGKWRGPFQLPAAQQGAKRETAMDRIYEATASKSTDMEALTYGH